MNDNYIRKIPEGYRWCSMCELLTPHKKHEIFDFECEICGSSNTSYDECPNCGWEHDPYRDLAPSEINVKKHTNECRKNNIKESSEDDCDCPEVVCYPFSNSYNYKEWTKSSLDFMNAIEWSYEVLCPICNTIFEVQDGNY